jgi:hypothetical protein
MHQPSTFYEYGGQVCQVFLLAQLDVRVSIVTRGSRSREAMDIEFTKTFDGLDLRRPARQDRARCRCLEWRVFDRGV